MRTLLALPAVALGAAASLVVPRDRRRWVVGCGSGVGEGALPLALAAQACGDDVAWVVRTDRDAADAASHGIRTVRGWRAFTTTLRAGVVVVTHGFGDVSRAGVHGAYVVQLWHGIPLKHLHRDAPGWLRIAGVPDVGPVRTLLREAHRRSSSRIRLLPVASERAASRMRSALGLGPDVVRVLGDARVDVLASDGDAARASATALLDRSGARGRATVLYAPTWRDGAADPAVPTADEWRRIAAWLEQHDARLVVRSHPHGLGDYAAGSLASDRIGLLGHDALVDVTPALPGVDLLVTDFSSIAYDASTIGTPTLLLAPDVASYAAARGLYDAYGAFSGGRHERTWDGLLAWASEVAEPGPARDERLAHARVLAADHVTAFGGSTARVLQAIDAALGHGEPPPEPTAAASVRAIWRDGDRMRLRIDPGTTTVAAVRLRGMRETLPGELLAGEGGVEASVPLTRARWGGAALVLPSDAWVVEVVDPDGARIELAPPAALPRPEIALEARIAIEAREASVAIVLAPPLSDAERAHGAQRALQRRHLGAPEPAPVVMLEAFYGTAASCNPAGIDRALAALRPDVVRAWSTVDGSVPIPEGAVRVVEGTEAWWRARAGARALVVNDWLRKRHRRMPHQRVLQTWHGTPLKRLALERDGQGLRTRIASILEGRRWDVLLAQNPFAAEHLRAAYAFRGPVWQLGYPRGDVLRTGDRSAIRARLGLPVDARVALYAPTWRDDRIAVVDHVDVAALAARLGEGWRVVVRGHARSYAGGGREIAAHGVVDATTYPDVAELLVAADVLVTDYSSIMFDAAGLELPTVFAVPDLDDYRDRLRGFTFDLADAAPGPFARTLDEVVAAVLAAGPGDGWDARRAAWRARFAPLDDGRAGERVVERMIAEGMLDGRDRA